MKTNIFLAITFSYTILLLSCSSTGNSGNQSGIDSLDTIATNVNTFTNYNEVQFFFKAGDTLFCKTKNGVKYYDSKQDTWIIDNDSARAGYKEVVEPIEDTKFSYQEGSQISKFTYQFKKHKTWVLIDFLNEASYFTKQDVADTVARCTYSFPYEGFHDFYIDKDFIWLGSDYGISKIATATFERTDYITLPAFRKIKQIIDWSDLTLYLDFDYGLFAYDKAKNEITPYNEINELAYSHNIKYQNATIIGDKLYILGTPMDRCGFYLGWHQRKSFIIIIDLKSNVVQKYESKIPYFDAFVKYNHYLICFGEKMEIYEGGQYGFYGGAVAYDLVNNKVTDLTDIPTVHLAVRNNKPEAISLEVYESEFLIYRTFTLNTDFTSNNKVIALKQDTIYGLYSGLPRDGMHPKEGDLVLYNDKKVLYTPKKFEEYAKKYSELEKQREFVLDSSFLENPVNYSEIKMKGNAANFFKY